MKRSILILFSLCLLSGLYADNIKKRMTVSCGDWIELTATPYSDYHFVNWSDGNTNAKRQVQVNDNTRYVAFFASNCKEYANLPVEALYDWLLMLNVRYVHGLNYHFKEADVRWFRVVGDPDSMEGDFPQDDEPMGMGFYLTIDQSLEGTGNYYAVIDVSSSPSGVLCTDYMRTVIVRYAGNGHKSPVRLASTYVRIGEPAIIKGLDPEENTHIYMYDAVGRLLHTYQTTGEESFSMNAVETTGCYNVVVQTSVEQVTLRFLVTRR